MTTRIYRGHLDDFVAFVLSSCTSNKVSVVQQSHGMHPLTSLLPYSNEHFSPSPPHLPTDMSQKTGVHRHQSQDLSGYYSLPPGSVGQITPSMGWQSQPVYPALSSCGFRQPYSSNLPSASSYSRFPHSLMLGPSGMHPTGIPHPAIVPPSGKQEHEQYDRGMYVRRALAGSQGKRGKKKRRKREKQQDSNTDPGSPKKCRARFGLNQQTDWCGPCRRKKKCIRYLQGGGCPSPTSSDLSAIDSPPSPSPARHRLYQQQRPLSPVCSPAPTSPSTRLPLSPPTHTRLPLEQSAGKRSDLHQTASKHTHTHLELSGKQTHSSTTALSAAKAAGLSLKVLTETQ
eukprot:superscaffoldBa00002012_g12867